MRTKTVLLCMVLLVLALAGVIAYGFERIKSENESASASTNESLEVNNANSVAVATQKDKDEAGPNLSVLDQIELTQSEVVPFIETIEKTGRDMGVKVKIASVNADPAPKVASSTKTLVYNQPQTIHISIQASGTWAANLGFVHALENLPHKIALDSVTLTYNPPANTTGNASSTANGYWQSGVSLTTAIYPD